MSKRFLIASIVAAGASFAAAAQAETLLFTYTEGSSGYDLSFEQSTSATPASYYTGIYTALPVTEISSNAGSFDTVDWYNSAVHGGFVIDSIGLNVISPQVYSGTEGGPAFAPGVWVGQDQSDGLPGTLTVSLASGVPEPASWALMILGIGLFGVGLRARRPALATT
ncbi:MAG TPA: PEPxxWA-CTERM sorting domain-containing protein [Caulobacteraceae bacterium]|jgi:hypothetical protein